MSNNSCVETPAAPEWLSKLENRRERVKRAILGHEAGAGAPCNDCGNKCPGLDLHFWRKVCRNCKCRKDQHLCVDDDLSGWAQFEILGQIRSKPAFIKIKALATQPVQVDWIPPNVAADVACDYMEKLGTEFVPVVGSRAAAKRKQQLEFQVPPHDLDANLCDSLTESEVLQLQQYVEKIRENCVGQGEVVRAGNYGNAVIVNQEADFRGLLDCLKEFPSAMTDPILNELITNEKVVSVLSQPPININPKLFVAFLEPFSNEPLKESLATTLTPKIYDKLRGLHEEVIKSLLLHEPIYDKIFRLFEKHKLDISRDPRFGPLADAHHAYLNNTQFKKELMKIYPDSTLINHEIKTGIKNHSNNLSSKSPCKLIKYLNFNSPLSLKSDVQSRYGGDIILQDTPIRKLTFKNKQPNILLNSNLPSNVDYSRDPIFNQIIQFKGIEEVLKYDLKILPNLDMRIQYDDIGNEFHINEELKRKLSDFGVDSGRILQSVFLNAPFYDCLFQTLQNKSVKLDRCKILKSLENLIYALRTDPSLYSEVQEYVTSLPNNLEVSYFPQKHITTSISNDSGFESKPSTPSQVIISDIVSNEMNAHLGKFSSIPAIEDMHMYPIIHSTPSNIILSKSVEALSLKEDMTSKTSSVVTMKCYDCACTIQSGEVIVKAPRAGKEVTWHPECFKCHICRELLADLVYFFYAGQVYCARDLAIKLKIPRCKACDELIFTKEYTAAENATFHIKHFCCFQCDEPLAGHQYVPDEKSNMPLCLNCYDQYYAAACQRCHQPIGPADQGVVWSDIHWHGSCFICSAVNCQRSLIGSRFCIKNNIPFCCTNCVRTFT